LGIHVFIFNSAVLFFAQHWPSFFPPPFFPNCLDLSSLSTRANPPSSELTSSNHFSKEKQDAFQQMAILGGPLGTSLPFSLSASARNTPLGVNPELAESLRPDAVQHR